MKVYQLGEYEIQQEEDGSTSWGWVVAGFESKNGLERFVGRCGIAHDTLLMSPWKVLDDEDRFDNKEEAQVYHDALPKWDQTKYYIKLVDFGNSRLMDCQTGEPSPLAISKEIAPKFGFTMVER